MRKFQIVLVSALILILALSFVACNNDETPQVDATLDANFIVDTTPREVNFGEAFVIEPVSAKDSKGEWHDATIEITDPNGNTTVVEAGSYTPQYLGTYKLTYKIGTLKREVVITVKDLSEPEITGMNADSLVLLGDTVDLSAIKVKDNIDGDVTPQISVKFGTEEIALTDNKFVADKKGCYVVTVKAEDAAGNKLDKTLNVFTQIDYEQNILQTSEFYPMTISDKFDSYRKGNVAKVNWFDLNVNWLNDYCLLGSKTNFISDAKYLSFWTYFDGEATDLNRLLIQTKYTYFDTKIYTEYGQELGYYWNFKLSDNAPDDLKVLYANSDGKFAYELETNKWYRIVIDLKTLTNASKYGVTNDGFPIDGALVDVQANPNGFAQLPFGFGMWDQAIGGQPTKVVDTYIDDIRLTNTLEDETYRQEIKVNVTSRKSVIQRINDTFDITYGVENTENGKVTFKSTNEAVATVDENGHVTCVADGQAKIVLTSVSDTRKTAEVGVIVAAPGSKIPDENNQEIFSGGESIGNWQTEGKYNMNEHIIWASNQYENGICNHSDLVSMSICHGNLDSYSPLMFNSDSKSLVADGSKVKVYDGWQAFVGGTDGMLFVFKAKQDIAIRTTGNTTKNILGGWVDQTKWQWVKIKADGTTEVLREKQGPSFGDLESEFYEIKEGETFVLLVRSIGDNDERNFEILPFFYICPMVVA